MVERSELPSVAVAFWIFAGQQAGDCDRPRDKPVASSARGGKDVGPEQTGIVGGDRPNPSYAMRHGIFEKNGPYKTYDIAK
jgi:hypothetical protein